MAEDIICTVPDRCGEHWTLAHYWIYDDHTFSVCDPDGNHSEVDADDVPSGEQVDAAWREYSEFVRDTGADPLHEFLVKRDRKVKERWTLHLGKTICGPALLGARRGKEWLRYAEVPSYVQEFACVKPSNGRLLLCDVELAELGLNRNGKIAVTIERSIPRNPDTVRRELIAAANRHLRRK